MAAKFTWTESDLNIRRSNFCKDHHGRIEVPDPLVVEDLVSYSWKIDEKHPDKGRLCLLKYSKIYPYTV